MRSTFCEGHVSLVTGASSGIGAAAALNLAFRGSTVAVHYRKNEQAATDVVRPIEQRGGSAFSLQADLIRLDSAQTLVDEVVHVAGRVDVLVNNAGSMIGRRMLLDITNDFWQEVMETNVGSVLKTTQSAVPVMIGQGAGAIINVGAIAARNGGSPGVMAYASAKAAVLCMTKGLAKELIKHGIRVNSVNPGVIDTPFHERFTSTDQMSSLIANIPQGRAGLAEEIASVIGFLASADASHIVGETIEVNGGILMD